MAINLMEKADSKVMERFKIASCTEGLFSTKYNWTGVRTVKICSVDTLPMHDYQIDKTDGSRFGGLTEVGDTVQELTITKDRSFEGSIDKGNDTSQMMIKSASSILRRQTDEVLIPEIDKYRLQTLATGAGISETVSAATKSNIVELIMKGNAKMSNELVPDTGRVLYMSYETAINLKLADQVIGTDKMAEKAVVNGVMGQIDKCQVRLVPSSYLPENTVFMIVKKGVAAAPKKIESYRILKEHPNIDGAVVQGRIMHDCFVFEAQKKGIYVASTGA